MMIQVVARQRHMTRDFGRNRPTDKAVGAVRRVTLYRAYRVKWLSYIIASIAAIGLVMLIVGGVLKLA